MKKFLLITLIQLLPLIASAETGNKFYDELYDNCLTKEGGLNNASVEVCSNRTSKAAKSEINFLYSKVYEKLSSISTADAAKFEQSQKSWIVYRNNHCELAGNYVGSPMYAFCPMEMNVLRISELQKFLD
jgi:uncharacterized protein YecT (DUF1311 family)